MGNISPLVNAFNGFSGKIFKINSENVMLTEFDTESNDGCEHEEHYGSCSNCCELSDISD